MKPSVDVADRSFLRWLLSAAVVLALHLVTAWFFLLRIEPAFDALPSGAIAIELAPVDIARNDLPAEIAPGPEQAQSAPAPPAERVQEDQPKEQQRLKPEATEPMPELVKAPDPDPVAPADPKQEKVEQLPVQAAPPPSPEQAIASAPQVEAEKKDKTAAASVRGVEGPKRTVTLPTWTSNLLNLLERNKRYPAAARDRNEQGTVHVVFVIDRQGRLLTAEVQRTSGSAALDAEALAMMRRAAPFPPPPTVLAGERISLSLPILFRFR